MSKYIHTVGPWRVEASFNIKTAPETLHPVNGKYRDGFCPLTNSSLPNEVREANVRLAAAAPTMLEALERMCVDLTALGVCTNIFCSECRVSKAIAMATDDSK